MRKRFRDFAKSKGALVGDKVSIADTFDKEIHLTGFRVLPSKIVNKECLQLQFEYSENSAKMILFTNSDVLIKQLKEYETELPFWATIKRHNAYYTLT